MVVKFKSSAGSAFFWSAEWKELKAEEYERFISEAKEVIAPLIRSSNLLPEGEEGEIRLMPRARATEKELRNRCRDERDRLSMKFLVPGMKNGRDGVFVQVRL